jgi:hypothetical protein
LFKTRRVYPKRFPFSVVYVQRRNEIVVYAHMGRLAIPFLVCVGATGASWAGIAARWRRIKVGAAGRRAPRPGLGQNVTIARRLSACFLCCLTACGFGGDEPKAGPITACARFSFETSGREDVLQARRQFYEAALQMKATSYSDSTVEGALGTGAEFFLGSGGRITLSERSDFSDRQRPRKLLVVSWLDQGRTDQGSTSIPCTGPRGEARFSQVRSYFGAWKIEQSPDTRIRTAPATKR